MPGDAKTTVESDRFEVILDLLRNRESQQELLAQQQHTILAQQDTVTAKIDALRAEGDRRAADTALSIKHLEAQVSAVRHEVRNVAQRVVAAESDIQELKDGDNAIRRDVGESARNQSDAMSSAMTHVRTIEDGFNEVRGDLNEVRGDLSKVDGDLSKVDDDLTTVKKNDVAQNGELAKQNRVDKALCAVLGLDYAAISAEPPSVRDTNALARFEAKPMVTLPQMARDNKKSVVVGIITIVILVLEFLIKSH